jgi:hypothetical protein
MFKPSIPRKNPGAPPRHRCQMSSLCGELQPHTTDQNGLKLRLTTRFRDLLASEKYTVNASQAEMFFDICEAEVVSVRDEHVAAEDGAKFRVPSWQISDFESFLQSYDLSHQSYYLKLHREEGRKRSKQDDQVPVSCIGKPLIYDYSFMNEFSAVGQFRFNILWLSPTIFVSSLLLETDSGRQSKYCVRLRALPVGRSWDMVVEVYSISSFETGAQQQEPSSLPLAFLRSMTKSLPANYFSHVYLSWRQAVSISSLRRLSLNLSICHGGSAKPTILSSIAVGANPR